MKSQLPLHMAHSNGGTWSSFKRKLHGSNRFLYVAIIGLTFGIFLTFINIYELRRIQFDHMSGVSLVEGHGEPYKQPVLWVAGKNLNSGYLKHVFRVFERLGYVRGNRHTHWDVLWAHDYPFLAYPELKDLQSHQKVNKFPGSGWITNKASLATSLIKHIPKAFKIPEHKAQFLEYAKMHPVVKWVQKSNSHRGIHIMKVKELDLGSDNTFVQEYIDDPFLVDGRRFDIGVYTTLASIDPLRVYINEGDWLVRYCTVPYYPFDASILSKYVVGDDYTPTWKMPSLKEIYNDKGYTHKETLLAYIRKIGKDAEKLKRDLEDTIRDVYLKKEQNLIDSVGHYKSSRNFFEMVRFDFVLDKDLNVYLMEVNMSPNLSTGHFPANKLLYESVVYGLLSLVGVARAVNKDFSQSSQDALNMQVSERDIAVYADVCLSSRCNSCLTMECKLCTHCMNTEQKDTLKMAHLEHVNKHTWRRIFPITKSRHDTEKWNSFNDSDFQQLNERNKWMTLWFHGKCLQSTAWCQ